MPSITASMRVFSEIFGSKCMAYLTVSLGCSPSVFAILAGGSDVQHVLIYNNFSI